MFDTDGDGAIDIPEFLQTLQSLGQNPSQKEIDDMMRVIDVNGWLSKAYDNLWTPY